MVKRVNVNFSIEAYETLRRLAQDRGTTMSQVLSSALATEKWIHEQQAGGGRILIERNGQVRELLWR